MRGFAQDSEDPLTRALAPPPNESPNEREQRLRAEAEAQRKSDQIDEVLKAERATLKKRKIMRMLLLGQSESGERFLNSYHFITFTHSDSVKASRRRLKVHIYSGLLSVFPLIDYF